MAIYELHPDQIEAVTETTFAEISIRERQDLQRLLRENIDVISPGTLVIAEEFSQWDDSRRRIDLLGVDKDGRLVVIELKRTADGGHMDLQALRYAAMISAMTMDQVVQIYQDFLTKHDRSEDAEELLLDHLDEPDEELFAQDIRLVLASAEFSKELTTSVMWLNERGLDITCVRLKPYRLDNRVLLDVQPVVPLPEAADYQVRVAEKQRSERASRVASKSASHLISMLCENNLHEICSATYIRRKGLMVFFLPREWDERLPKIGDAWAKRLDRPTPMVFWFRAGTKRKRVSFVAELGRVPNTQFRQQLVRDLRDAGFSIGKQGDRADARYTRILSKWSPVDHLTNDSIDSEVVKKQIEDAWNEFAADLPALTRVLLDRDWTGAEKLVNEN